jgi:hypothetical protein
MLARPVVLAAVVGLLSGSSPRLNAIDVEGQVRATYRCDGSFTLAGSVLTGHLAYQGETVPVAGFAWTLADRQFHTRLSVPLPGSGYTIHVTLAER